MTATSLGTSPATGRALPRPARRVLRSLLLRYARARPREDAPPRVLIMLASAWGMGGTIRAALNVAGYLAPRHDVEIVSVVRRRDRAFLPVPAGVRMTALDDVRHDALPWGVRHVIRLLRNVPSVLADPADPASRSWNLWVDIGAARKVHRQRGFLLATRVGLNLFAADVCPPGLVTIGLEQMNLPAHARPVRELMKRRYPRLNAFVVLTDEDERRYRRLLSGTVPVHRIPNTVHAVDGAAADLDAPTILAAGRLTRQKGFDFLIEAFARVSPDHPQWRLRICGGGPRRAALQALIDARGLGNVVTLVGAVENLGAEMAAASVFALSSRREGFPLVLIEAMSRGMAVIAFDIRTGPRDIIDDHRNGLLVPPRNVDALANALREMITDPQLRRRCGEAAPHTSKAYTIDAIGPRWDALLAELGAPRPRPAT